MDYSDNIYFSKFAVDPDADAIDHVWLEDMNLLGAPLVEQLGDELLTDLDYDCT